jgi:hypothetical protein
LASSSGGCCFDELLDDGVHDTFVFLETIFKFTYASLIWDIRLSWVRRESSLYLRLVTDQVTPLGTAGVRPRAIRTEERDEFGERHLVDLR